MGMVGLSLYHLGKGEGEGLGLGFYSEPASDGILGKVVSVRPQYDGWVVVIDPGHGGIDAGAFIKGMYEKGLNRAVAKWMRARLETAGIPSFMTRSDDEFLSLHMRAEAANRYAKCIFVSIHHNSAPSARPKGIETYYTGGRPATVLRRQREVYGFTETGHDDGRSEILAKRIQAEVTKRTGAVDRGIKDQAFVVTREPVGPAVLVECGFLTNSEEAAKLRHPDYQKRLGHGIADGVLEFIRESGNDPLYGISIPGRVAIEPANVAQSANSAP